MHKAPPRTQKLIRGGSMRFSMRFIRAASKDSNGDGIGDLNGITSKLDYLKDLGVNAIWTTPCFPSPQVDFGYDVSDYVSIDPMYGTLEDFDKLAMEAKNRNIRVILDFVVNHTSDQHKWFLDSKSSKNAEHRDWYIWKDGEGPNQPPNNWMSTFGLSAWKFDPATNQYYYHYFYPEQPDLNLRNPAVEKAMFDVTRFWYKRGVAGFRLDAVDTLFEDPILKDNPVLPGHGQIRPAEYGGEVQQEAAGNGRGAATAGESGRRVRCGADRRDVDERCERVEGLLRPELQRIAVADGLAAHAASFVGADCAETC
jgi:glycosidase